MYNLLQVFFYFFAKKFLAWLGTSDGAAWLGTSDGAAWKVQPQNIKQLVNAGAHTTAFAVGDKWVARIKGDVHIDGTVRSIDRDFAFVVVAHNHNAEQETNGKNSLTFMLNADSTNAKVVLWYLGRFNSVSNNTTLGQIDTWAHSELGTTTMTEIFNAMPLEWQKIIGTTTKYTDNVGSGSNGAEANITATQNKLFFISEYEYKGTNTKGNTNESKYQKQYTNIYNSYKRANKYLSVANAISGASKRICQTRTPWINRNNYMVMIHQFSENNVNANDSGGMDAWNAYNNGDICPYVLFNVVAD